MTCVKCSRTWPKAQFVGKQGQPCKTCRACRVRSQELDAARMNYGGVAAQPVRVTVADHPRVYLPQGDKADYDATHAEILARGWMLGADPAVNWCGRHSHRARRDCDDCLTEAAAWQYARKTAKTLANMGVL